MKLFKNILINLLLIIIKIFVTFMAVALTVGVIRGSLSEEDTEVCLIISCFIELSKVLHMLFKEHFFSKWGNY